MTQQAPKHTPRPWTLVPEGIGTILGPDGKRLALTDAWNVGTHYTPTTNHANACLIAAAPDLLALAHAIAEHFADTDAPLGRMARSAIAKAEGEGEGR